MSRTVFLILMVAIAAIILITMWIAWRARTKRDASILDMTVELTGATIAEFQGVAYVSTTALGRPLDRVAVPGLTYRGSADLTVRADGLEIEVVGEHPVRLSGAQLRGTGVARGRIGKVVERDGLGVLQWQPQGSRVLESAFRFADPAQRRQFQAAVEKIS